MTSQLSSPLTVDEIIEVLKEQACEMPSFWSCLITLNGARYSGTSYVVARMSDTSIELRNRRDPFLSWRAFLTLAAGTGQAGARICIKWKKPVLPPFLFREADDKQTILGFMAEWLKTEDGE